MSDEAHIESAHRHRDQVCWAPWHGKSPDEEIMEREEPECASDLGGEIDAMRCLLFWIFNGVGANWREVACRILTTCIEFRPECKEAGLLSGFAPRVRPDGMSFDEVVASARPVLPRFRVMLDAFFPPMRHEREVRIAAANAYLLARHFFPSLLEALGPGVDYERLAVVFQELPSPPEGCPTESWCPEGMSPDEWRKACGKARSRWSARAQVLLARPIAEATGRAAPALFNYKMPAVREKLRKAATGNSNRLSGHIAKKTAKPAA